MNICHLVFAPDSLTYLVAKACACAGHKVYVCLVDPARGRNGVHKIMDRIVRIPGVAIVSEEDEPDLPSTYDRLIVQVFPRPQAIVGSPMLGRMAARARRITLVTAGDRSRFRQTAVRMQWKELRSLFRWFGRIDRVTYKDGFHPLDLFAFLKPRHVAGFDIHSMFLDDEAAFAHIQGLDWQAEARRRILINFMGSQDPAIRKRALDSIRHLLAAPEPGSPTLADRKRILWHEFSDAQPGALGLKEFVDALSESDFTLCPPGYSLITHRPIEAMLRGSIPILHAEELDLYDIGLVDRVNCIAVRPGQWPAAIERCGNMEEESIIAMRRNIRALVAQHLLFPRSSRRTRRNFRIEP